MCGLQLSLNCFTVEIKLLLLISGKGSKELCVNILNHAQCESDWRKKGARMKTSLT